ncbi:MAG: response regulator [Archangium sp.]|nr:response regulator [Archangium sp.]
MNPTQAKLLIAEDDPQERLLLRTLMQGLGVARIDEAPDGRSALELLANHPYDLVLADWNMPFLTGIQLANILRENAVGKQVPVLLISGEISARRTVEALKAGVIGLVAKPFLNAALCQKVLRILASVSPVSELSAAG